MVHARPCQAMKFPAISATPGAQSPLCGGRAMTRHSHANAPAELSGMRAPSSDLLSREAVSGRAQLEWQERIEKLSVIAGGTLSNCASMELENDYEQK